MPITGRSRFDSEGFPLGCTAYIGTSDDVEEIADDFDNIWYCDGVSDDVQINAAIDYLPDNTVYTGNGETPTGKMGKICIGNGFYRLDQKIEIPVGSVLFLDGECNSPYVPIKFPEDNYYGGVVWYSDTAEVLDTPQTGGGYPATYLWIEDMEFRSSDLSGSDETCVNLQGWIHGKIDRVNVLSDFDGDGSPEVYYGILCNPPATSTIKWLSNIHAYHFRLGGIRVGTSHIRGDHLSCGSVSGFAWSSCFWLGTNKHQYINSLQCFSANRGISFIGGTPALFGQVHFESVTNPVVRDGGDYQIKILHAILDSGVNWNADINDPTKVEVEYLTNSGDASKKVRNSGTATITNGTNSVAVTHNLITTPLQIVITGTHTEVESCYVSGVGAANFTINKGGAGNVTANRDVYWYADASRS